MKQRTRTPRFLSLVLPVLLPLARGGDGSFAPHGAQGGSALAIRELAASGAGQGSKLCAGASSANIVRVQLVTRPGAVKGAILLRLRLVVAGGGAGGLPLGEGSLAADSAAIVRSYTFSHVAVPARLRDRGARLVVIVEDAQGARDSDARSPTAALSLDAVADWACGERP